MGHYRKLPPLVCECGYSASGDAFKRNLFRWLFGKVKCPKCKSTNLKKLKVYKKSRNQR